MSNMNCYECATAVKAGTLFWYSQGDANEICSDCYGIEREATS